MLHPCVDYFDFRSHCSIRLTEFELAGTACVADENLVLKLTTGSKLTPGSKHAGQCPVHSA